LLVGKLHVPEVSRRVKDLDAEFKRAVFGPISQRDDAKFAHFGRTAPQDANA